MKMKKISITLALLISVVFVSYAKDDKTNYELMKNVSILNYTVDYSSFKIAKIKATDYVSMKLNMDIEKFISVATNILIENANESLDKSSMSITNTELSDVDIKVMFLSADKDGENTILCKLVYKPTDTLISSFEVNSNGGDDDNFQEEFMKSLAKTGKKLGKQIAKIKAASNSTK